MLSVPKVSLMPDPVGISPSSFLVTSFSVNSWCLRFLQRYPPGISPFEQRNSQRRDMLIQLTQH